MRKIRQICALVHPDLFYKFPHSKTQNSQSLATLNSFLSNTCPNELLATAFKTTITFHYQNNQGIQTISHKILDSSSSMIHALIHRNHMPVFKSPEAASLCITELLDHSLSELCGKLNIVVDAKEDCKFNLEFAKKYFNEGMINSLTKNAVPPKKEYIRMGEEFGNEYKKLVKMEKRNKRKSIGFEFEFI